MHRANQYDIHARNQLNAMADILERDLINAMAQFNGKKVWKISGYGGFTAAAAKALDSIIDANGLGRDSEWTVLFTSHVSSINCELRLCYSTTHGHCDYAKESFRIGRRSDDGILTEPEDALTYPEGRPQFTQRQVESTLQAAYDLETQARKLRSTVSCFQR